MFSFSLGSVITLIIYRPNLKLHDKSIARHSANALHQQTLQQLTIH